METKHWSYMNRYGTTIFGNIVVYVSKLINNDEQIFLR